MYTNVDYFLTPDASITVERGDTRPTDVFLMIMDSGLRVSMYMSEGEARVLATRFESLKYHNVFYAEGISIFGKKGGLIDTLKTALEGI